jgi:hypothetical protein
MPTRPPALRAPRPPTSRSKARPQPLRFVLEVQPEATQTRWHATLRPTGGEAVEFESPIALLRHLAAATLLPRERGGLR